MPKRRSRGLGDNPLEDLTTPEAAQESTQEASLGHSRTVQDGVQHEEQPQAPEKPSRGAGGGPRRWKRVMVYLDPETDGRWLNEVVGRARAEGLTQRQMGETEILRAGLAELRHLSWEELVKRVTERPRSV